ncbi:hypothetical protein C8R47DRAFT_985717 [Mycena vitilis]|nr:hypothetical protein C8R47DRAFT_985717 [Mycena vitilis]
MAGERNRDHVDPCREFNIYTALFQAHFSGVQLTSPQGLSNTISWFGTGQGAGTEKFLNSLLPDGGFFKVDAAGMVGQFQSGIDRLGMSDMPVENQKAWGNQPNPALAAQPTKKTEGKRSQKQPPYKGKRKRNASNSTPKEQYTLQEKFAPYFAEVVQGAWSQHLGGVAGKDPATVPPAELPRWSSTIKLLAELEIPAFKTGLTAMQLVNTLAFSKVVQLPTVTEMAEWISDNPKLGAVTGLSLLGFRTGTRDQIQASYICFHHILEKFLTRADQEGVGFHPPFTEHVLCKTPRWDKYLARDKSATLVEIAAQLQGVPWISGQNINDATALPLPSVVSRDDLQSALSSEVCALI